MPAPDMAFEVEIVLNRSPGRFRLSEAAARELARRKGVAVGGPAEGTGDPQVAGTRERIEETLRRDDPDLVAVVRAMGPAASGPGSDLRVAVVPVTLEIEEREGLEEVGVFGGGFAI